MSRTARIKIELRSDLCVGSGYSYAGVIDSDVVADPYGFPYIPARRLKGCMREAAVMIEELLEGDNTIDTFFGTWGDSEPGRLVIENAYLDGYAALIEGARALAASVKDEPIPEERNRYSRDAILQQFTNVRAQTMIKDDGTVKDNTLRFIRVVNQTSPLTDEQDAQSDQPQNLAFYANVTYPDGDKYEQDLRNIVQATRSLGMDRNRGLGHVWCTWEPIQEQTPDESLIQVESINDGQVAIHYTFLNTSPLMISQSGVDTSENYIPGRVILGALAANYLAEGHKADDPEFRDLFLDGSKTQYLNAYITDADGQRCIPVPDYIRRLKKTRKVVNYIQIAAADQCKDTQYNPSNGNQPKSLSGQYCTMDSEHKIRLTETERQLVYHHRHQRGKRVETQLYAHLEIQEGQRFAGVIHTQAQYKDVILHLLAQGLRLGKSKSAQYGGCVMAEDHQMPQTSVHKESYKSGDVLLVSLSAPAVFLTADGQETVQLQDVYNQVAQRLGIDQSIDKEYIHAADGQPFSMISTRLIYGYQAKWNQRRPTVAAIAEGSVLVYRLTQEVSQIDSTRMVGVMNLEGYGEIHLERLRDMPYQLETRPNHAPYNATYIDTILRMQQRIDLHRQLDAYLEEIRGDEAQQILHISASELGRVTLMLQDALNSSLDYRKQYEDFSIRVMRIRDDRTEKAASQYVREYCDPDRLQPALAPYWGKIAMEGLICRKYDLKKEDANKGKGGHKS